MFRSIALLAGLVGISTAKVLIFNAEKCNTNFDDAANFFSPDATEKSPASDPSKSGTAAPKNVQFQGMDGTFESVDVKVNAGSYEMGTMILQDNMIISLEDDGVEITFNEDAAGADAYFTAGQTTDNAACSVGCHTNFLVYSGIDGAEGAAQVSLKDYFAKGSDQVTPASEAPCGTDVVVIPKGYNVNLLAMGFHAFKKIAYMQGDELIVVGNEAQLPEFMFYPHAQGDLFLGDNVVDQCADAGMINDADQCVCATECPANTDDALAHAAEIRDAQSAFGAASLAHFNREGSENVVYTYTGISADVAECFAAGGVSANRVETLFETNSAKQLQADIDGLINFDDVEGTIVIKAEITGLEGLVGGISKTMTWAMDGDEEYGHEAEVAKRLLHATMQQIDAKCDKPVVLAATEKAIGYAFETDATFTAYAGTNMAQQDVNALVSVDNKDGVVDAVYAELQKMEGFSTIPTGCADAGSTTTCRSHLRQGTLAEGWVLKTPEERKQAAQGGRRARATPVRYGLATNLIQVELEYTRNSYSATPNAEAIEQLVNHVLATYDVTTHHKCFTLGYGFDDDCINDIVANIIADQLALCDVSRVKECRAAAVVEAKKKIVAIRGCGLLGADKTGACRDPAAEVAAGAAADIAADAAVVTASLKIETAYNITVAEERARQIAAAKKALSEKQAADKAAAAAADAAAAAHATAVQVAKIDAFSRATGFSNITELRAQLATLEATYDGAYKKLSDELKKGSVSTETQNALELAEAEVSAFRSVEAALAAGQNAVLAKVEIASAAAAGKEAAKLGDDIARLEKEIEDLRAESGTLDEAAEALDKAEAAAAAAQTAVEDCETSLCGDLDALTEAKSTADAAVTVQKDSFVKVQEKTLEVATAKKDQVSEQNVADLAKIQQIGKLAATTQDLTALNAELKADGAALKAVEAKLAVIEGDLKTITDKPGSERTTSEKLRKLVLDTQYQAAVAEQESLEGRIKIAGAAKDHAEGAAAAEVVALQKIQATAEDESIVIRTKTEVGQALAAAAEERDLANKAVADCTDCTATYKSTLEATAKRAKAIYDAALVVEKNRDNTLAKEAEKQCEKAATNAANAIATATELSQIQGQIDTAAAVRDQIISANDQAADLVKLSKTLAALNSGNAALLAVRENQLEKQQEQSDCWRDVLVQLQNKGAELGGKLATVEVPRPFTCPVSPCTQGDVERFQTRMTGIVNAWAVVNVKSQLLPGGSDQAIEAQANANKQLTALRALKTVLDSLLQHEQDLITADDASKDQKQLDIYANQAAAVGTEIDSTDKRSKALAGKNAPASDSGGGMMIIVAAAVVVLLLLVIVYMKMSGGGGGGGGGSKAADRATVAFENPMYDDPGASVAAAPAGDAGLYDEPAFNEGEGKANPMYASNEGVNQGGGGYLDVQPDSDDDDDDDDDGGDDDDDDDDSEEEESSSDDE